MSDHSSQRCFGITDLSSQDRPCCKVLPVQFRIYPHRWPQPMFQLLWLSRRMRKSMPQVFCSFSVPPNLFVFLIQHCIQQLLKKSNQMCEILSISTKTGYRILREGKILSLKVGRAYRIPKAHLFTFALFCRSSVLLDFPTDFPTNFCYACFCSVAMINLAISGFSCSSR